jgi:UDP-3-O-[3-hydroxymyristoyl] N-acetylglucosamine deacetylase/3-hydroxyacyl-[acyl-carrier-protein] dehydratase
VRADLPGNPEIPARVDNVISADHSVVLENGQAQVRTVEHLLAAAYILGLDNLRIETSGPEMPILDGSFLPYLEALRQGGTKPLGCESVEVELEQAVWVQEGDRWLLALPNSEYEITCCVDYAHSMLGTGFGKFTVSEEVFDQELAQARTLGFARDAEVLRKRGLARAASAENTLVVYDDHLSTPLRMTNEPLRHKVGDVIGDLALVGGRLRTKILAIKPGHRLNLALAKRIVEEARNQPAKHFIEHEEIERILPHRYPFLFIDRVLELEPGKRIRALKNVAANEPYFQGHFPGRPLMPGVLILEAMAQAGGILVLRSPGIGDKLALLAGAEKVRFRRAVTPGDQMIIDIEMIRWHGTYGRFRAVSRVNATVVAEAVYSFVLVDPGAHQSPKEAT